jgi:hypothetical protein
MWYQMRQTLMIELTLTWLSHKILFPWASRCPRSTFFVFVLLNNSRSSKFFDWGFRELSRIQIQRQYRSGCNESSQSQFIFVSTAASSNCKILIKRFRLFLLRVYFDLKIKDTSKFWHINWCNWIPEENVSRSW